MPTRSGARTATTALVVAALLGASRPAAAAASFATSRKDDGIPFDRSVRPGDPVSYAIRVVNSGDADGLDVVVHEIFDPCLDLGGFDPLANPSQVTVTGAPAVVDWMAAARTLDVRFTTAVPP